MFNHFIMSSDNCVSVHYSYSISIYIYIYLKFQPIVALIRPLPGSLKRKAFNWIHWGLGTIGHILAGKGLQSCFNILWWTRYFSLLLRQVQNKIDSFENMCILGLSSNFNICENTQTFARNSVCFELQTNTSAIPGQCLVTSQFNLFNTITKHYIVISQFYRYAILCQYITFWYHNLSYTQNNYKPSIYWVEWIH